jgi:hypothetical protein
MPFEKLSSLSKFISGLATIGCFSLLFACGSNSSSAGENTDSDTSTSNLVSDSKENFWDDSLKKYFTPPQIIKIKKARADFYQIKTASELAYFYHVTLDTVRQIVDSRIPVFDNVEYSGDNSPDIHWAWFDDYFVSIKCDVLCSQCDYSAFINLVPLAAKAKETPEKEDDMFFELGLEAYGPDSEVVHDGYGSINDNQGNWTAMFLCDVCIVNMIGSGYHSKIIKRLEETSSARKYFKDEIDNYLTTSLNVNDQRFYHKKEDVIAEIDLMLTSPLLNEKQKTGLNETREKLNTSEKLQFECGSMEGTGKCTCDECGL